MLTSMTQILGYILHVRTNRYVAPPTKFIQGLILTPLCLPLSLLNGDSVLYVHRRAVITIRRVGVRCNGRADDIRMTKTPAVMLDTSTSMLTPERPGKDPTGTAARWDGRVARAETSSSSLHHEFLHTFPLSCRLPLKSHSSSYVLGSRV